MNPRLSQTGGVVGGLAPRLVFYYDLGDPECYLMAERIMGSLPVVAEWEPVLGAELGAAVGGLDGAGASATVAESDRAALAQLAAEADRARLAQRAAELGLQPFRWPARWPSDTREAMLAATYAKRIGRAVAFSLAAFRQAFAGGRDLAERDTVLIAGAACEMHPAALLKGIALHSTARALERATARARRAGVRAVPAVQVGDKLFGDIEAAVRALGRVEVERE